MFFNFFECFSYLFSTLGDIEYLLNYSMDNKLSYTVVFDESLNFSNNLSNLPLPASERMNSLVILYLEVSYITLLIFFIVSFILLETLLVHSSSE